MKALREILDATFQADMESRASQAPQDSKCISPNMDRPPTELLRANDQPGQGEPEGSQTEPETARERQNQKDPGRARSQGKPKIVSDRKSDDSNAKSKQIWTKILAGKGGVAEMPESHFWGICNTGRICWKS